MIFVDSTVWIGYFNGVDSWQTNKLDDLLEVEAVIIGDIVLTEVLQGFKSDADFEKARQALDILPCYSLCGKQIALKSAENFRALRKKGVTTRKTIDVIIATFCIENQFILLHDDRDFTLLAEHLNLSIAVS